MPPITTTWTPARRSTALALPPARRSMISTGNSILLGGPITNQSGSTQTIGLAMQLVPGGGMFNTAAGNITLSGALSGGRREFLTGEDRRGHSDACRRLHLRGLHQCKPRRAGPWRRRLGQYGTDRRQRRFDSATLQVNGNYTIGTGGGARPGRQRWRRTDRAFWLSATAEADAQHALAQRRHDRGRHFGQPGPAELQPGQQRGRQRCRQQRDGQCERGDHRTEPVARARRSFPARTT